MRSSSPFRVSLVASLAGLSLFVSPGLSRAQDEAEDTESVATTALILPEAGASDGDSALVSIGVRRGLGEVPGVRFTHPVDVLSPPDISEDLAFSFDELEPLADQVRTGDARDVADRAASLIDLFEQNLLAVRREQLIDAYMLRGVALCRLNRARDAEAIFSRVVVFREGYEYDSARYPAECAETFATARDRTLAGPRASLEVNTEPTGAEVYVDGRSYGPSPVVIDDLLVGDHYITIKHIAYVKAVERATVARTGSSVSYALLPNARSALVASGEATSALRGELGEERAGSAIRSLGNTLGAAQVVIGVARPLGDELHVQLFLYDVRTRFLLNRGEFDMTRDEAGMEVAREAAVNLYAGVDLSGAIDAPIDESGLPTARRPEVWEEWWFWTAIGAGAVAVGVGVGVGVAASQSSEPALPAGWIRFDAIP
jgi:hypothetical protein